MTVMTVTTVTTANQPKCAFLCADPATVRRVYDRETTEALATLCDLDGAVLSREDILQGKGRELTCLFSTWGMPSFSAAEIATCLPSLQAVFYAAGSVQAFAAPFLAAGVRVFSAWGANAVPVAEYTVAQIILANKGYFQAARLASVGERRRANTCFSAFPGNYDTSVGIIGAGMIGRLVIRMLAPYRLRIKVFDPFLPRETAEELGVTLCSLEELFSTCQTVSNHLANNAQTKGMLCGRLFDLMADNATFLNTGRGAQVVEEDLVRALREHPNRTAVLDVTDPEPPADGHPFYDLPNVVLTPHMAGSSGEEVRRMGVYMLEEFRAFADGAPTRYEVTADMLRTMA